MNVERMEVEEEGGEYRFDFEARGRGMFGSFYEEGLYSVLLGRGEDAIVLLFIRYGGLCYGVSEW